MNSSRFKKSFIPYCFSLYQWFWSLYIIILNFLLALVSKYSSLVLVFVYFYYVLRCIFVLMLSSICCNTIKYSDSDSEVPAQSFSLKDCCLKRSLYVESGIKTPLTHAHTDIPALYKSSLRTVLCTRHTRGQQQQQSIFRELTQITASKAYVGLQYSSQWEAMTHRRGLV